MFLLCDALTFVTFKGPEWLLLVFTSFGFDSHLKKKLTALMTSDRHPSRAPPTS